VSDEAKAREAAKRVIDLFGPDGHNSKGLIDVHLKPDRKSLRVNTGDWTEVGDKECREAAAPVPVEMVNEAGKPGEGHERLWPKRGRGDGDDKGGAEEKEPASEKRGERMALSAVGDWSELSAHGPHGPVTMSVQADGAVGKDEAERHCPVGTVCHVETHDGRRSFVTVAHDSHPHPHFLVPRLAQVAGPPMPQAMGGVALAADPAPAAPPPASPVRPGAFAELILGRK